MILNSWIIFIISFLLCTVFTFIIRYLAIRLDIVDKPDNNRKIHKKNIPLLGGVAIFLTFFIISFLIRDILLSGTLEWHHWFGVFVGATFLIVGGILDDKSNLTPVWQFVWPVLAVTAVIIGGVNIEKITNPFGGYIYMGFWSGVIIAFWLLGMMYTTKLLDGVDGLVSGVVGIGAFVIFLFTMTNKYYQPDIGTAALILSAVCFGFLIFNWHPASIFLGEGGSTLLGFILGVLAIISGGKIAIALLVMGIPILDVAWTIIRRIINGKNPFRFSDKLHLHFRLLNLGIGQRRTVIIYYVLSGIFGLSALFMQSLEKIFTLSILVIIMLGFVIAFNYINRKSNKI